MEEVIFEMVNYDGGNTITSAEYYASEEKKIKPWKCKRCGALRSAYQTHVHSKINWKVEKESLK